MCFPVSFISVPAPLIVLHPTVEIIKNKAASVNKESLFMSFSFVCEHSAGEISINAGCLFLFLVKRLL